MSSRIQLICPSKVCSAGILRSLLDNDLYTDSASMVRDTLMARPPTSRMSRSCRGVSAPALSSWRAMSVG
eukprot:6237717-Pyramimonas_sp.AAC.1